MTKKMIFSAKAEYYEEVEAPDHIEKDQLMFQSYEDVAKLGCKVTLKRKSDDTVFRTYEPEDKKE